MEMPYDFSGWATRANVKCTDGRTILKDAFKECDGKVVPLVWNHMHNDPNNVLGHALLKSVDGSIYAYGSFNDNESANAARELVKHGDITSMSILANQLIETGPESSKTVIHGVIREVSLVLAGANPEAFIEDIIMHDDSEDKAATIYFADPIEVLLHGDDVVDRDVIQHAENEKGDETLEEETKKETTADNETIGDVFNTLSEKQKTAVYAMIEEVTNLDDNSEGGEKSMKQNAFDQREEGATLSHDAIGAIIGDAKRFGSMRESYLQHASEYGIDQIEYLMPDPKAESPIPEFIKRDTGWVSEVMGAVHRTPFSRIKSIFADITDDDARAKGYYKGKLKKEEVFALLKRSTTPTTVYKKQKMDRDDVVDITGFDVVAWLKSEMRMMLDEELARAILVGDGRLASSDDKISEQNIRPVWTDAELYTIKSIITVASQATEDDKAKAFIRAAVKARKDYKGSGNPVLYTTEDLLTDMLLLTDATGRDLYDSVEKLAKKLRVSKIVTVPVMEGLKSSEGNSLMGIIVNLRDYKIGADKGGAVNMFEDFDIDYNQQKYLIETRCSGALTKPYSAIALELKISG